MFQLIELYINTITHQAHQAHPHPQELSSTHVHVQFPQFQPFPQVACITQVQEIVFHAIQTIQPQAQPPQPQAHQKVTIAQLPQPPPQPQVDQVYLLFKFVKSLITVHSIIHTSFVKVGVLVQPFQPFPQE